MEWVERIFELLDINIILCLPATIITIAVFQTVLKKHHLTKDIYLWIKWFVVIYVAMNLFRFLLNILLFPEEVTVLNRATGIDGFAYITMTCCALLLPFTLLIKRLGASPYYLLLIVCCLKTGWYLERLIIIATSLHRDYNRLEMGNFLFESQMLLIWFQGFLIALALLGLKLLLLRISNPSQQQE